jgi:hypothetical protein
VRASRRTLQVLHLLAYTAASYPDALWPDLVKLTVRGAGAHIQPPVSHVEVEALYTLRFCDLLDPEAPARPPMDDIPPCDPPNPAEETPR